MKLCKDCKWHKPGFSLNSQDSDMCAHPLLQLQPYVEPVRGIVKHRPTFCMMERNKTRDKFPMTNICGVEGSLWQSKEEL